MSEVVTFPRQPGSPPALPARTSPALAAALARIARIPRVGSPYFVKKAVRRMIKDGHHHGNVWRSYQGLAERHPHFDLAHAILFVELMYRQEIRKREVAIDLWRRYGGTHVKMNLLKEARLALRWIRRHVPQRYPEIRSAILFPELVQEAAE